MKLIYQSSERHDIEGTKLLLESRGIPVHVANEDTNRTLSHMAIAVKIGIWVVFDDQYGDALALINDESHEVENPRDVAEFYAALKDEVSGGASEDMDRFMLKVVVGVICGLISYAAYRIINS